MTTLTDLQLEVLRELRAAFPDAPIAVIGAAALGMHVPMTWRNTADIDLVIAVSVDQVEQARSVLVGWRRNPKMEHRWHATNGLLVDLVPAPPSAVAKRVMVWPESGDRMGLAGMRQALAQEATELAPGLSIIVPSVPVIVLLKMAAYVDRPGVRDKDLGDLAHILDEYPDPSDDRLYADEIIDEGLDDRRARPFVLGRELAQLVDNEDAALVRSFFALTAEDKPGWGAMLRNSRWRHDEEEFALRVHALRHAFESGRKK